MTSIPWLHRRFDSFSRIWVNHWAACIWPFELWVVNVGSYSLVFATTVFCHPLGCAHPFPLLIAELLQSSSCVINQILCVFHMTFFTTSKAHLSYCIFTLYYYFILISSSFFIFPSFSFLTCCLILYMPVKNMNDFILVFLSLHILCSALNQRNTNPFVVYRHLKIEYI